MVMPKTTTAPGPGIRKLRQMAGMTLGDVANAAGVSVAYLSKVETGRASATPKWFGMVTAVIAERLKTAA